MRYVLVTLTLCLFIHIPYSQDTLAAEASRVLNLRQYEAIHFVPSDHSVDAQMASVLRAELAALYQVDLPIRKSLPERHRRVICVGRAIAARLGLIGAAEFEAVKWDGYLIRANPDRVVIAGFAPPGTIYGTYAFLKKIGLAHYPWHFGGVVKQYQPVPQARMAAFSVVEKPFFELRDVLGHLGGGRFGATIRPYMLGELRWARKEPPFRNGGYLGWDHTAGYLVPIKTYLATHPEFYPTRHGVRIPPATPPMGVGVCACHPELETITIKNALTWMARQPKRRLFGITDGDQTGWRCAACAATDPIPGYYTDRNLRWVNAVARAIREPYPDNRVFTLAYLDTVKPPLETGLEPNALVFYAPWYWTSRQTSAVGFEHPWNITAMEELIAWTRLFPGQIGVYDYTGAWVYGAAERIKLYAQRGVRWVYMNGARGNLLHWVASQLLWNPHLDVEPLIAEFIHAFYGPAADIMSQYHALRRDTLRSNALTAAAPQALFHDAVFLDRARHLLRLAPQRVKHADVRTRTRVLEAAVEQLYWVLHAGLAMQADVDILRRDFELYLQWHAKLWDHCDQLNCSAHQWRLRTQRFEKRLRTLSLPKITLASTSKADRQRTLTQVRYHVERHLRSRATAASRHVVPPPARYTLAFNRADETQWWQTWASDKRLAPAMQPRVLAAPHGENRRGAGVSLPLSQLPKTKRGRLSVHAGHFRLRRRFEPAIDARQQRYISLHLHVSHAVPVTLYINGQGGLFGDLNLYPGEQIVRIDVRNFSRRGQAVIDLTKIESITLEIWPQNLFYPYPETRDTDVLLLGIRVENTPPTPQALPYRGKAIWMSHFRANKPHGLGYGVKEAGLRYMKGSLRERFRSSTPHRILSPITSIVTGTSYSPARSRTVSSLRRRLKAAFGVALPVRTSSETTGPSPLVNALLLGSRVPLAQGHISAQELDEAGHNGFVIRARDGAIAIAGNTWESTRHGVSAYLHRHGIRLPSQVKPQVASVTKPPLFLHELYLLRKTPLRRVQN